MTSHKRNIYLQIIPVLEAQKILQEIPLKPLGIRYIPSHESIGHVLAETLYAQCSSPNHHSTAMDGIAVRAEDTYTAREDSPITLTEGVDFVYINTGNILPSCYNAVIMIEHIIKIDEHTIRIEAPAYKWQHIRKIGEDIIATQVVLPKYHKITAYDIGYMLTAGIFEVPVYVDARICIIPTGDELCPVEARRLPNQGEVIESNSHTLKALCSHFTSSITVLPRVKDDLSSLIEALEHALQSKYNCILLCSGSSAGSKDFTKTAISHVGKILFHGIKAMPGKPTMLGVADRVPIIGVPGYPGSSVICFEKIISPLLERITYRSALHKETIEGYFVQDIPSRLGIEEYIKVRLGYVNNRYVAIPLPKATGSTSSIALAEGICTIPSHKEGVSSSEKVYIELHIPKHKIAQTIVCIGSHDDSLDIIDSLLSEYSSYRLCTVHTGSMGGIFALKNNTAHCAGMHLLHKGEQDFTIPYLRKYLPSSHFTLYTIAMRSQCLYVPKGNPKNIRSIKDIITQEATFINRQNGSGTRLLFDSLLEQEGLSPQDILGYHTEEYSHLSTALHVATGHADCALGIYSAGASLGLECIPITEERYELVIPKDYEDLDAIQAIYDCITSPQYKEQLHILGGYSTDLTGAIRIVSE